MNLDDVIITVFCWIDEANACGSAVPRQRCAIARS
jgi:hypothetical protein